jgi:hypothetical protein
MSEAKEGVKAPGEKAPYEKPRLRVIELAAEEVLGTSCKSEPVTSNQAGHGCLSVECKQLLGS